ncbi:hypothetical protein BC938DRAFT_481681 [Jimgerdemannia flammicorona]|uniref:Calcium channel YVC1-like C-terminal transmembrane domain-containing protein n=1 Tax=Jimgerdemannia flammicorona TaxID=994334 RepID=A0A433QWX0_9FUNG|nr:hypothetical protein BC938DRAFT_481681 [Jimgerdemannia flammicorona]
MPDDDGRIVYTVDEGDGDLRERAFINADRLVVPKYQNIINIILSLFFLVLYSVVVNQARTAAPGLLEWFVYIVVAGNVVDELQQIWKGGLFYFYSLWNCLSFLIYLIFTGAFTLRIVALMTLDSEHRQQLNNTAFDVLSTLAIFLWMRVLSILDSWRYFGSYAIILQSMFKDGIIFFFLLIWVLLGFSQAFLALRSDLQHDDFKKIVGLLIQGYLSSPDFELAADFHPILGHILYVMFIFISVVILQSLLFSLFATSFQNVIDKSQAEYLTSFTFKTLSLLEAGYDLPSPFNLIGLVLLTPLRLFFSHRTYRHARRRFITITFLPVLLFIAWYERGPGRRALAQLRFDSQGETAEEEDMPLHPTTRDLEAIERILGHRFASKDAAGLEDGDVSGKSGTSGGEASKAHGETLERRLAIGKMMDMLAAIDRKN